MKYQQKTRTSYNITWASELNPVWHRMLYSRTHMATVGVKGLIIMPHTVIIANVKLKIKKRIIWDWI